MMYLDENFDINTINKSLFDLIKLKFRMTGKNRYMKDEDIDDMMQEWFLTKCRLGNAYFIRFGPAEEFRKARYKYEVVGILSKDAEFPEKNISEERTEVNIIQELITKEFGEVLCEMFFDKMKGHTLLELGKKYGMSDNTVGRRIKRIQLWLKESN